MRMRDAIRKLMFMTGCIALALFANSAYAADFPIQSTGTSGHPGDRVFIELTYDYGSGFGVTAEDLQFEYQFANMTFVPSASTIDVSGAPQNLPDYADTLQAFAQNHEGSVLVNMNFAGSTPDFKGYALSFTTATTPHVRSGMVHLRLAFDIQPCARPQVSKISFTERNVLVNEAGTEFQYPAALQSLDVTVQAGSGPSDTLSLTSGWNAISFSLVFCDASITNLLSHIQPVNAPPGSGIDGTVLVLGSVWEWNGSQLAMATVIEPGKGYLLYLKQPAVLNIKGTAAVAAPMQLTAGWHLVGPLTDQLDLRSNTDLDPTFWFRNGQHLQTATLLRKNRAYWIHVNHATTIKLSP